MSAHENEPPAEAPKVSTQELWLFWACFIALVATAFAFITRALIMDEWQVEFGLNETQKGEIFGVGLWPFAVSIVLFSLIIDRIGYGKAMAIAFICHVAAAVILIFASQLAGGSTTRGYWVLYIGSLIMALGNGTVEAVINPVVATMFPREKTKWLAILHAGWPGGLVLGGILMIAMGGTGIIGKLAGGPLDWQWKVAVIFLPVVTYGILMLGRHFPVSERVAAGVSYKAMLQQVGILGALIVTTLIVFEVARVFTEMGVIFAEGANLLSGWTTWELFGLGGMTVTAAGAAKVALIVLLAAAYGVYTRSLGRPMFVFLLLIMIPLATTELGTDSWITSLMEPEMIRRSLHPGWVLVYTSLIMLILRFFAGPIVHKLSPLGLLAVSALLAAIGLVFLSQAVGLAILSAATIYGIGKTFFWPAMLGVVAEQYPEGGALTLNTIAGVGMLSVGVVGTALLGNIQDREIDQTLESQVPIIHAQVAGEERLSVFGRYRPLDSAALAALPQNSREVVEVVQETAKKNALMTVAIFPCIMFVCYVGLILYFKAKGGYKPKILVKKEEEDLMMSGGVEGPAEM